MNLDDRLNRRLGIEAVYTDQNGGQRRAPPETIRALRAVLGPPGCDQHQPGDMLAALAAEDRRRRLDPVTVLTQRDSPLEMAARAPRGASRMRWRLVEDGGREHHGEVQVEARHLRWPLPKDLPLGYHTLTVEWAGAAEVVDDATVVVAPRRAYLPACVRGDERAWGIAAQLYSLRSARNWGIGDFGDLLQLIEAGAAAGADAIGVNPLHALFPDAPESASPYSPSSRLFLNPLYLDVAAIEDFAESGADRLAPPDLAAESPLVDYARVASAKQQAFEAMFAHFSQRHRGDARGRAFREFQAAGGEPLRRFATFQAIREAHGAHWRTWPERLRDPASPEVLAFARTNGSRVELAEYLQWQASLQLGRCARHAQAAGMGIGLYGDLAVGFDPDGADAWSSQALTATGWSIGAPPDNWSLAGQNWGLPPPHPIRMRADRYRGMIAMLRANMRDRGALRIDHVLGLKRLFWIPETTPASAGAYVRYPFDDLLALIALESHRHRCMVIGEDLGTVPDGFREMLQARGILSCCLMYFERADDGGFRPPRQWARNALASISTHDLPTLAGFWTGRDIELRQQLSLYADPRDAEPYRHARQQDKARLVALLRDTGECATDDAVPSAAVHRLLGRTASRLAMVQIEDMLELTDPVNVPGTVVEHPNWRRKLPLRLDQVFADAKAQAVLQAIAEGRAERSTIGLEPRATYRLQMHRGFGFDDAIKVLPYLQSLGISHVYLSSILEAQPGSTHGYDIVNYDRINPELGGPEGFARFAAELRRLGLGLILDFVPNHMGVGGARNAWWLDVLEWGQHSPYARMFDIDWSPVWPELRDKVLAPLLGEPYDAVLQRGDLELRFDAALGSYDLWYHDHRFPIRPADYPAIIRPWLDRAEPALRAELAPLVEALAQSSQRETALAGKRALAALASGRAAARDLLQDAASAYRQLPPEALDRLLEAQHYRLCWWRSAARRGSYRRFFDINQLASLRMDRPKTFDACHRLIAELVSSGMVQGLRLDHIDGLRDPAEYLRRLRRRVDRDRRLYVVVEKILARHEAMPADWPIDGSTGYEFANLLNGLFVDPRGAEPLRRTYAAFIGDDREFQAVLDEAKADVIDRLFGAELTALAHLLGRIAGRHWRSREYDADRLRPLLREVLVAFPVYRSYVNRSGASPGDRHSIGWAMGRARKRAREADRPILTFIADAMTTDLARNEPAHIADDVLDFALRMQQLSSPVMAKSLEDTAFYRHGVLLSLNEVGGDPDRFGVSVTAFHRRMRMNRRGLRHAMLATSTHDTKRGEDARARLNVLSEMPAAWAERVAHWSRLNRREGTTTPAPGDEYLIYQTLVGAWPEEPGELGDLADRMQGYVIKAVREAKRRSSWADPDPGYERTCVDFVRRLLRTDRPNPFLEDFGRFHAAIRHYGMRNSLAQLVLKLTVPGVPDTYQGSELWDLNLVDPDNRRPVDFTRRASLLAELDGSHAPPEPAPSADSGQIKLWLLRALLSARRASPRLFAEGSYRPLRAEGPASRHVIAFERRSGRDVLVVLVGRLLASLPGSDPWHGTSVAWPSRHPALHNLLTGERVEAIAARLVIAPLFGSLPVAVLRDEAARPRSPRG